MMEDLARKVALWATETGMHAARLSSQEARTAYFAQQHREIVATARQQGMKDQDAMMIADSCIDGAKRIMNEILARGVPSEGGTA